MSEPQEQPTESGLLEVGPWQVEPGLNRLRQGSQQVMLEPRVVKLLLCLARHAGRTVSKEELLAEVWGGAFVAEGVVTKAVSTLRQSLGDETGSPRFVLTVNRRGYRLIAPVRWLSGEGPPAAQGETQDLAPVSSCRSRFWVPGRFRVLCRFRVLGAAAMVLLSAVGLLVVHAFRQPPAPLNAIRPVVSTLPAELEARLLEARLLWSRRGQDDLKRADQLFASLVQAAPDSVEARAWRALSLVSMANYWRGSRRAALLEAEVEVGRALALASDHPVARTAAGLVALNLHFAAERAVVEYRRALAQAPELAPAWQFLAEALSALGRHDEAIMAAERAVQLEPTSALMHSVHGLVLQAALEPEAALRALDHALALEPRFGWLHRYRAYALIRLDREAEAATALVIDGSGREDNRLARRREIAARAGLAGLWQDQLEFLEAARQRGRKPLHIQLAEAHAALGQVEDALLELESGAVGEEAEYFLHYRSSPAFDALRDHPRFRSAYARYGL